MRAAQDAINRPAAVVALTLLRRLPPGPIPTPAWVNLVALLFRPVVRARESSVVLAKDFYASQTGGRAPQVAPHPYSAPMLAKALQTFARPMLELPETHEKGAVAGSAALVRHIDQANREYIVQATSRDDIRFARVDPHGETCAFCRLLISRGPVYLSQVSGAFQSHPHCTCVAVPVADPHSDWPGRDQFEAAEQQYAEATAGKSGKDAIRAFRRAVEGT